MKLRNLLNGQQTETVYKADEKFEPVFLETKDVTFSYFADPMYIFVDGDYEQYEIEKENLGDSIHFIEDGMEETCQAVFYNGKAISVELPTTIVRTVAYTYELQVAAFIEIGERIEIDTRTGEFKSRAKN